MDTRMNAAVEALIADADKRKAKEPVKDAPPGEFRFNEALDNVGLPLEGERYINKNCGTCYGKGYVTRLVGNGYKDGVQLQARQQEACICVHRGYTRQRLQTQREIAALEKAKARGK